MPQEKEIEQGLPFLGTTLWGAYLSIFPRLHATLLHNNDERASNEAHKVDQLRPPCIRSSSRKTVGHELTTSTGWIQRALLTPKDACFRFSFSRGDLLC